MFCRSRTIPVKRLQFFRSFATRSSFDSPFDHLPKLNNRSWFNWKTTTAFFLLGSYLAYNETLFNYYEKYTEMDEKILISKFYPCNWNIN